MARRHIIGAMNMRTWGNFFDAIINGIYAVAEQYRFDIISVQGTPESVARSQVARNYVDGWLVISYIDGVELLAQQGKPIVTISTRFPDQPFPAVLANNKQGMAEVMEHLFATGHERIAFIGFIAVGDILERMECYQAALIEHGLPFDPSLVVITDSPMMDGGVRAAQRLIAAGMPCTAIVAGTDWNALGAMGELQAHGYRIPQDVAVVGFDDIPQARGATPPLSTVRQHFETLGNIAIKLLIDQLSGIPVEPRAYYIPTVFIQRESSGKRARVQHIPPLRSRAKKKAWQEALANQVVQLLLPASIYDPARSAAEQWPEVDILIRIVEEAVTGTDVPTVTFEQFEHIFTSLPLQNAEIDVLVAMLRLLEQGGFAASAGMPDVTGAQDQVADVIDQLYRQLLYAHYRRQEARSHMMDETTDSLYRISKALLLHDPQMLEWLSETSVYSGCLGTWNNADPAHPTLTLVGAYQREESSRLTVGSTYAAADFPPLDALPSAAQSDENRTWLVLMVRADNRDWGLLALAGSLVAHHGDYTSMYSNHLETSRTLLELALERITLQETLLQTYQSERQMSLTIRELSCPVIPLMPGVLLIPLIGTIDSDRAQQIVPTVLEGITEHHAHEVLFDISGVPIVDTQAAQVLIHTAQAATLLGAQVILVGMRPEIAQSIVSLDVNLRNITTQATLATALELLYRRRHEWSKTGRLMK